MEDTGGSRGHRHTHTRTHLTGALRALPLAVLDDHTLILVSCHPITPSAREPRSFSASSRASRVSGCWQPLAAAGRYRNPVTTWNVEPHARAAAQWALVGGKPGRARYRDVSSPAFRSSRVTGPDEHAYGTRYKPVRSVGGRAVGVTGARNSTVRVTL